MSLYTKDRLVIVAMDNFIADSSLPHYFKAKASHLVVDQFQWAKKRMRVRTKGGIPSYLIIALNSFLYSSSFVAFARKLFNILLKTILKKRILFAKENTQIDTFLLHHSLLIRLMQI